ncbi:MAG: hypothetical protein PHY34_00485 [Patescibacteria group bacterium]|nr:hypothetical protein [Patescibacteria group bacterium]MDD5715894.1 hypothetical protein [Patescibacteria group bacterium]
MDTELTLIGITVFFIIVQFGAYRHYARFQNVRTSVVVFLASIFFYLYAVLIFTYGSQIKFYVYLIGTALFIAGAIFYSYLLKKYKNQ